MDVSLRQHQPLSDSVPDLLARPAWHENAACSGLGNELFYPGRVYCSESPWQEVWGNPDAVRQAAAAKVVCALCPVKEQCLEAGLEDEFGIWGGTTERDRRKLRRERRLACS